jgi:quercetin dioxygenase-like cupin family protein
MLVSHDSVSPYLMFPGVTRRILNTGERLMVVELYFDRDSVVPVHTHPHEQGGYLASGRFRFVIGDEERILEAGDSWLVPSGVPHTVTALEDSVAIDVFCPPREDFLAQENRR